MAVRASDPLPLALTIGEPAGIGPDIAIAAWHERHSLQLPPFYLIADSDFVERRAASLGLPTAIEVVAPAQTASTFSHALPVVALEGRITASPAKPDDSSAPAAIGAIRRAFDDVMAGHAAAMVTNPIAKSVLYRAGFTDPGHTEFLGRLASERTGEPMLPVMMIWSDDLAVVPVTIHIPLRDVKAALTSELILDVSRIVARDMNARFGIRNPRLAVAGLNPHAGEDSSIGDEDMTIIAPAIEALTRDGIDVRGPLPADTMFHAAARAKYDVAICMYHDQALIPVKTLAFDSGVNVTLGLPFVRTSPDHGTAFDIAGSGRANSASLVAALKLAARLARPATA